MAAEYHLERFLSLRTQKYGAERLVLLRHLRQAAFQLFPRQGVRVDLLQAIQNIGVPMRQLAPYKGGNRIDAVHVFPSDVPFDGFPLSGRRLRQQRLL